MGSSSKRALVCLLCASPLPLGPPTSVSAFQQNTGPPCLETPPIPYCLLDEIRPLSMEAPGAQADPVFPT